MAVLKSTCLLITVLMIGSAMAQSDQSIAFDNLPPEVQGKLNQTDVENIKNQTSAIFREKCEKNGGMAAFEKAQKSYESFPDCVKTSLGLTDGAKLQKEIDDAKPNGTVDEVFKKYCAKTPEAKKCFTDMMDASKPCFSADEQKNLKTVYNITQQLAEFICYKDGDRIALFIAEDGPDCIKNKSEAIQQCANSTMGLDYSIDTANISANAIPEINFGEKECMKFSELQECVVGVLQTCKAPTSANIIESLFKFVRQATPCRSEPQTTKASASGLSVTAATLAIALTTMLI